MSLVSYQLQIKRYLKELGLSDRDFNKLDVKHSDVNLLKQLQLLNPIIIAPAPPAETGFWGTFEVFNERAAGSNDRYMDAYLAYNNVPLTPTQRINSDTNYTFNVAEADRLPLPNSTLQLKVTCEADTEGVNLDVTDGFEVTGSTDNPLDEENIISVLVNENNYDDGQCSATIIVSYEPPAPPPPPANTGWYGKLYIVNTIIGGGGRGFTFSATTANGTINVIQQYVEAGTTYEIDVPIGSRLPAEATISFVIDNFDNDAAGYDNAYINGTTYSGTLYNNATLYSPAPSNNITITIPVDNDT